MKDIKPLLASPYDPKLATWPMYLSPKLDGIRVLVIDGQVFSRSLKLIPNAHVQKLFGRPEYNGLDGEIIVGSVTAPDVYLQTYSGVMSKDGEPNVRMWLFDDFTTPDAPFISRLEVLRHRHRALSEGIQLSDLKLVLTAQALVFGHDEAMEVYDEYLTMGYEGIMLRRSEGRYKFGRSTAKEGILLKHKPLADSEAEIITAFEQMQNNNEATRDELGHTKRSSHQENLVGKDTLGGFTARDVKTGIEFNVGIFTGLTDADRKALWNERGSLPGLIFKYQYLAIGVKERPRHPRFIGWRSPIDM